MIAVGEVRNSFGVAGLPAVLAFEFLSSYGGVTAFDVLWAHGDQEWQIARLAAQFETVEVRLDYCVSCR